jgi:hypothetical protein
MKGEALVELTPISRKDGREYPVRRNGGGDFR